MVNLTTILETYTLEDLLEQNDITNEELLEFLIKHGYVVLPEVLPLDA